MEDANISPPRYLMVTLGFIAFSAALIALAYYSMNSLTGRQTLKFAETANVAMARGFAQTLWGRFGEYVSTVDESDPNALRARPETERIRAVVREAVSGLPVLKLKIINAAGMTVYSSQENQIGESKANNVGFRQAMLAAEPASKTSHRASFETFSDVVSDVSLVESYVPITGESGAVGGVFELYTDVSAVAQRSDRGVLYTCAAMACLLLLGYIGFMMYLRHIWHRQGLATEADAEQHRQALRRAARENDELRDQALVFKKRLEAFNGVQSREKRDDIANVGIDLGETQSRKLLLLEAKTKQSFAQLLNRAVDNLSEADFSEQKDAGERRLAIAEASGHFAPKC